MRRVICTLAAVLLLCCNFANAEMHLQVFCSLPDHPDEKYMDFDLYEQDDRIYAFSSLLPGMAAVTDTADGAFILDDCFSFFSVKPEIYRDMIISAEDIITEWIGKQRAYTSEGVFSGSMFDYASSKSSCSFEMSEFTGFLEERVKQDSDILDGNDSINTRKVYRCLSGFFSDILAASGAEDLSVYASIFHDAGYYLFHLVDPVSDSILLTLSADLSMKPDCRLMVSYMENGKYCYIRHDISSDNLSLQINSSIAVSESSVLPEGENHLIRQSLTITSDNDSADSFVYILKPNGVNEPIIIKGTGEIRPELSADIVSAACIGESGPDFLKIYIHAEQTNERVLLQERKILNLSEKYDKNMFLLAACAGMMQMTANILPVLPEEYQNLLIGILSPF